MRTVVKSPGVPREAPVIAAALDRGIDVIGELELAWRAIPNRFLAVTGTNGKTTTVELLGHVYRTAAEPVAVAGNVGTPLASLAGEIDPAATVICEASSFQLEDTVEFAPECAVFLNLSPDHLDRHRDLESYLAAKLRIFANQGNDDVAVYNADDPALAGTDLGGCGRRIAFCVGASPDCEVSLAEGTIFYDGEPLLGVDELGLFGEHNVANAMAAAAAALAMGIDRDAVREGLRSFAGVPHRLEQVAEIDGVRFVNDSKATNVASAGVGLRAFAPEPGEERSVHAILGGSDKGEDFGALVEPLRESAAAVYLIGATSDRMAEELAAVVEDGVELHRCADLEDAVRRAAAAARPGGRGPALVRPAPASTPSRTSKGAASASARSSGSSRELALPALAGREVQGRREGLEGEGQGRKRKARAAKLPPEYNMLLTATLCLLAFGAVMVFSASSTTKVLSDGGLSESAYYLKRTLLIGAVGLGLMHFVARHGLESVRRLTPLFLAGSFFLLVVVLFAGSSVNGSSRWIGSGFFQIQPSELAKVALVLYAADLLASKPKRVKSIEGLMPFLLVVGSASLLIVIEPDLGTALVVAFAAGAMLVAAGARMTRPGEDRPGARRAGPRS